MTLIVFTAPLHEKHGCEEPIRKSAEVTIKMAAKLRISIDSVCDFNLDRF